MLYAKRFFPYYVYNILGGIEEDGQSLADSTPFERCTELTIVQVQVPCTLTILWAVTSEKPVELPVPLNLYYNLS